MKDEIELAILGFLEDGFVEAVNDGRFVAKVGVNASNQEVRSVLWSLVSTRRVYRSRQWQGHPDRQDHPVYFWLPCQKTPAPVLAYRR